MALVNEEETSVPSLTQAYENVSYNDSFESPRGQVLTETRKKRNHVVVRELSLYVKGIVNGMTRNVLEKEFSTFGTVKNLDVVPLKSCAFVEFGSQEAYQQALTQKRIIIQNLGTVTVEERKQKAQNTNRRQHTRHDNYPTTINPAESELPSTHSTWANLASSNSQKWDNTQLAEPRGRVVSPQLTRTQKAQSNRGQRERDLESSLYVKGIVDGMNKNVLTKAFSTFGAVKNLDVVPLKSCAFVEFCTQEAYQQALMQKQITILDLGFVTVEKRKQKQKNTPRYYRNYQ